MSEQKTAIVTGASRGIGHAVAERFRSLGWRVITVSRSPIPGGCPRSQEPNTHVCMDLSDLSQIGQMVDTLRPMLGDSKLHALVNNAGVSPKGPGGARVNSLTTDMQTWQEMYNTNFFAPLALTRGFAQELSNAHGAVVNLCSIAGYRVHPFAGSAYASSKAALASLTREMANDMAPLNVRVNAIAPGPVWTPLNPADKSPEDIAKFGADTDMRRPAQPEELSPAYVFLASPACSSYITGIILPVTGSVGN